MTFSTDWLTEYAPLPIAAIGLSDAQVEAAIRLSDRLDAPQRWAGYLSALSLIGFEHWLTQRTPTVTFNRDHCRILEPISLDAHTVACRLQVNGFRVCLITTDSSPEPLITVPPLVLQTPDLLAHFYVAIAVLEDIQQVVLQGWLRHDQLVQHHQSMPLPQLADGSYSLSPSWFEPDCDRLLQSLDLLNPAVIPLTTLDALSRPQRLQQLKQVLVQPAIAIGQWMTQQLDEVAIGLRQILLPPLPALELRETRDIHDLLSPTDSLVNMLISLARRGVEFPLNTHAVYQDLNFTDMPLRLYSLSAELPDDQEWSLLVILGRADGLPLAIGTTVQISDGTTVVVSQTLEAGERSDFLYAQVAGNLDESFLVSAVLADGSAIQLPPFVFRAGV